MPGGRKHKVEGGRRRKGDKIAWKSMVMHFDKDCGGPKNQTHVYGRTGKIKAVLVMPHRMGYRPSTENVAIPERSRLPRLPRLSPASACSWAENVQHLLPIARPPFTSSKLNFTTVFVFGLASHDPPLSFGNGVAKQTGESLFPSINESWCLHRSDLSHRDSPPGGGGGVVGTNSSTSSSCSYAACSGINGSLMHVSLFTCTNEAAGGQQTTVWSHTSFIPSAWPSGFGSCVEGATTLCTWIPAQAERLHQT